LAGNVGASRTFSNHLFRSGQDPAGTAHFTFNPYRQTMQREPVEAFAVQRGPHAWTKAVIGSNTVNSRRITREEDFRR
jgi:hypothetical protein